MLKFSFLLFAAWLSQCVGNAWADSTIDDQYYQQNHIQGIREADNGVSFLVLGDWGRNGHFYQQPVARWMDIAAYQLDPDFIATTGDNFYDNGVASVEDPYWITSFEAVYHQPHLFIDWFVTLGNHDYRGNWQAQIDYSAVSRRWNMPARYYSKTLQLPQDQQALVLFIDTSPLNPDYDSEPKYAEARAQGQVQQLDWIEQQLAASSAQWKLVIGHHPLYSSGKRYGETGGIRDVLEPVFERHQVDAYFAGHEHDLQHNQPAGKTVTHFVSGGGSEIRPVKQRDFTRFARSTGGFAAVTVGPQHLLVQFIDHNGEVIYRHAIDKEVE